MRYMISTLIILTLLLSLFSLVNPQSADAQDPDAWQPVRDIIDANELTDLVVMIGNQDGIVFVHRKGENLDDLPFLLEDFPVPIASSSKWWTAATIMVLVEEGTMSLDDNPQDYIDWWTDDPADPRSQITLAQLISMTSGFEGEPLCIQDPNADPEACARNIYDDFFSITEGNNPGEAFYYSSSHMHIAGVMAVKATGVGFADLFRQKIGDPLDLDRRTAFSRPSTDNPFLAGGGISTTRDYATFLGALFTGELLGDSKDVMFMDWTPAPTVLLASPLAPLVEWHYGLGAWRECLAETWQPECDQQLVVSSGGGLGWFPWIDFDNGYYAVIGRRGLPLTGAVGPSIILSYEMRPAIISALAAS